MKTDGGMRMLFDQVYPGFFEAAYIRALDEKMCYEEMALWLKDFSAAQKASAPEGITFGFYLGSLESLHECVRAVDTGWAQYFQKPEEIFCAFDGDRVVSFCLLDDMGEHLFGGRRVNVAGPGCIGTIPAYRKRGIGLRMVQLATQILKERSYDISYIHYTGVAAWYAKLGYETICKWNRNGILQE